MKRKTTEQFIKEATIKHGDYYDYSKTEYHGYTHNVCVICPIHGEFLQPAYSHLGGCGCKLCSYIKRNNKNKSTHDEFIKACNKIHNNKYNYSKVEYTHNKNKITIICPDHGEFIQIGNNHRHGQGCPTCGRIKQVQSNTNTLSEFIERSNIIHGNKYDYSNVEYIHGKSPVSIICPDHGEFWQMPYSHVAGKGCQSCSHRISKTELMIFDYINTFIEADSGNKSIKPYELDIFIPSKKIAIEYDGIYWHSESKGKDKNYHLNKTKLCSEKNIQLIHIFEDEWLYKQSIVKNRLRHMLNLTKYKIYGRKCEVREIDNKTKRKFLEKYHIQGDDMSSIRLGLFYRNRLMAVMTFSKRRFDKKEGYELVRYCTVGHFTVVGGAGKLLKYFERNWNPRVVISYADRRWSNGGLYKALGFDHIHNSRPNYWYFKKSKNRFSRQTFMKHKLKDKLKIFDENLTEWENMNANGWDRIWDCGNMVFEKKLVDFS